VPALRTFQAAIARELTPMERAAAAEGREGQRRHQVYVRWEAAHRNQRWEADHFQLDLLVLPPRARRSVRPWLTVFVDAYSRLVMG
jgi:putative transposase